MPYSPNPLPLHPSETLHRTVPSTPPPTAKGRPRSIWPDRFDQARKQPNRWFQVFEPMTKNTAAQIASDIRSAHRRDVRKMRMKGLCPGERWEAAHGHWAGDPHRAHFYVWIRWMGAE